MCWLRRTLWKRSTLYGCLTTLSSRLDAKKYSACHISAHFGSKKPTKWPTVFANLGTRNVDFITSTDKGYFAVTFPLRALLTFVTMPPLRFPFQIDQVVHLLFRHKFRELIHFCTNFISDFFRRITCGNSSGDFRVIKSLQVSIAQTRLFFWSPEQSRSFEKLIHKAMGN